MNGMVKVRLLLTALTLGLLALGGSILNLVDGDVKWLFLGADGVLFLTACVLMSITFFALDEQGRIPKDSLVWKYFASFHEKKLEEDAEGKETVVLGMPPYLRLCPSYWKLALGVAFVSVVGLVTAAFFYLVAQILSDVATGSVRLLPPTPNSVDPKGLLRIFSVLGGLAVATAAGAAVLVTLLEKKRFFYYLLFVVAVAGSAYTVYLNAEALGSENARRIMGKGGVLQNLQLGATLGLAALDTVVLVFSLIVLLSVFFKRLFGWVKDTVIWRVVLAFYHQLCPEIPIEGMSPVQE